MSSSMDHNNNLRKNPGMTEQLYIDRNGNYVTICKESSIMSNGKGHTVSVENLARKTNAKKIYTTNGVSPRKGRSLSNKEPVSTVNLTTKPNPAANDMYGNHGNHFNHGNYFNHGNHITHDNWQTQDTHLTNYNHHTIGNIITNGNHINDDHFIQSDFQNLNEENGLPFLTDIIKELPELSIHQVSEVLSSFEDDSATGKIDTPLLDSKQVYQVLSNFNPEFLPFPFQYMDLFHSNAFSMPRRHLENSHKDTSGNTYHQDAPDRTKINYNLSPEPQNHLAKLPSSASVHLDQGRNTDRSVQKSFPCASPVPVEMKTSQSIVKTQDTSKVSQNKTKPKASRIPIKVGKVKSNRKNDTKTGLQKGMKISHGPKLGHPSSYPGTPSSKSFATPKRYKCDKCSKTFTRLDSLTQHLKIHVQKSLHVCKVCQKSFQTKSQLNSHAKTHDKHKCKICRESFETNKKLASHQTFHIVSRSHKCDVCEKVFTCSSHLKRHSIIHTRAKAKPLSKESKSFSRQGNAKKPAKVKLCCKFCLKQFQVEKWFQNHVQKCVKK